MEESETIAEKRESPCCLRVEHQAFLDSRVIRSCNFRQWGRQKFADSISAIQCQETNHPSGPTTSIIRSFLALLTMKLYLALAFSALGTAAAFAPASNGRASTSLHVKELEIQTGKGQLDTSVIDRFNQLPYPSDKILAEYVWVDAKGETRSKTRTLPAARAKAVDALPRWNFDGSSTDQAPGDDSEVILRPCRIFRDPFRPRSDGVDNILVMCDTYTPAGEPLPTNTRAVGEFKVLFSCYWAVNLANMLYFCNTSAE